MSSMVLYGLLFPSLGIHLFANRTNPRSSSPTLIWSSLVCVVIFIFTWLIFVLSLSFLCHPTHPYLLSPHFDFWEPTWFSAIVSHLIHSILISPYVYYWVWSVRKTCPNTGGEGAWKLTKTSWVHCRLWMKVPATYPPITGWVHSKCFCRFQVKHMMWVHLWTFWM